MGIPPSVGRDRRLHLRHRDVASPRSRSSRLGRAEARRAGFGDRADLMLLAGLVSLLPALLALDRRVARPDGAALVRGAPLGRLLPGRGRLRDGPAQALRVPPRREARAPPMALRPSRSRASSPSSITFADEARRSQYGVERTQRPGRAPLPGDPRVQPAARTHAGAGRQLLRPRPLAAIACAVREISEAMVSMLSMNEIGDRILAALTDTMGVSRAMVLLFDDERSRACARLAWRGDWDQRRHRHRDPLRPSDLEASVDAAGGARAAGLRRRSGSTRSARAAGTSTTPSRSSSSSRSSSASTCSA